MKTILAVIVLMLLWSGASRAGQGSYCPLASVIGYMAAELRDKGVPLREALHDVKDDEFEMAVTIEVYRNPDISPSDFEPIVLRACRKLKHSISDSDPVQEIPPARKQR